MVSLYVGQSVILAVNGNYVRGEVRHVAGGVASVKLDSGDWVEDITTEDICV